MTESAAAQTGTAERGQRRTAIGTVTSDKANKTRRVEIPRLVKHPRYGKYIRRRTICHVHDENNESRQGDTVEIVESRLFPRTKHWRLIRVVSRARGTATTEGQPAAAAPTTPGS